MRRPPQSTPLGRTDSQTRGPRSRSALNTRSGGGGSTTKANSGKDGTKKGTDGASTCKSTPASTGATPSLSLGGLSVPAAMRSSGSPPSAPLVMGERVAEKHRSPTQNHPAATKKLSPPTVALFPTPTGTGDGDEVLPVSARVTFLEVNGTSLAAPTPRRSSIKSKRSPLDAIPGAGPVSTPRGSSPRSQPSLMGAGDAAPGLQLLGRPAPAQRGQAAAPLSPLPSKQGGHAADEAAVSTSGASSGGRGGLPGTAPADPLPPLSLANGPVAAVSSSSPTGNIVAAARRPMTLLERRSGRERNAMSISCLSTLSIETIQESSRDVVPMDSLSAAPILRGWSRTVANPLSTQKVPNRRSSNNLSSLRDSNCNGGSSSTVATLPSPQSRHCGGPTTPAPLPPNSPREAAGPVVPRKGSHATPNSSGGDSNVASPLIPRSTFARLCASRGAVKLVSYNILADRLVTTDRYPTCPPIALGEDYRTQLMKKELQHVQADILVLAEMSVAMFENPNLLGGFLRDTMDYDGDHVVITDPQGKPLCRPRDAAPPQGLSSPPPVRRSTAPAVRPAPVLSPVTTSHSNGNASSGGNMVPVPPISPPPQQRLSRPDSRLGSSKSSRRDLLAAAVSPAGKAPSVVSESSVETPHSLRASSAITPEETPTRRTEMEGVAIFYNKTRFELLERVPIRFNEIAMADTKLTLLERKKLQAKSHNVALISVLRDRAFPTHVYLVAAVHIIWQRVESQLWQSRTLMQTLEKLKCKYDLQWREGKRTRPPSLATTPAKGAKHEVGDYTLPAVLQREGGGPANSPKLGVKLEPCADEEAGSHDANGDASPPSAPGSHEQGSTSPEQHAVCVVAGDFNCDHTSPVLHYLCEGYVPTQAPVVSYWCGEEGGLDGDTQPVDACSGAEEEETDANERSSANSASTGTTMTSNALIRRSTQTLCGEELSGGALASATGSRKASHQEAAGPKRDTEDEEGKVAGDVDGDDGDHLAPHTPQKRKSQQQQLHGRRRLTAPARRKASSEGCTTASLWWSSEGGKSEDALDDIDVSPAKDPSPHPVRDNWCNAMPVTPGTRSCVSLLDGSGSNAHSTEGAKPLSTLMMSSCEAGDVDWDDAPLPPPPPAARRKKKHLLSTVVGGGAVEPSSPSAHREDDRGSGDHQAPLPQLPTLADYDGDDHSDRLTSQTASRQATSSLTCFSTPPTTPSKAAAAAKCKRPLCSPFLEVSGPHTHTHAAASEGSSQPDCLNQSTAVSESTSSVLSNALDAEPSLNRPQNSLFTPDSLDSIFNEAAVRVEAAGIRTHLNSCRSDAKNATAAAATDNVSAPDPHAAGTTLSVTRSNSSPSLVDASEGSDGRVVKVPGNCKSTVSRCPAPLRLLAVQSGMPPELPLPVVSPAPGITHKLRLHNAYETYCHSHPSRVSAVNPSTNQEGKVLDHILYEPEHVACASVLRLGELLELPTRNIPSDHYMVGALLVPRASLGLPTPHFSSAE